MNKKTNEHQQTTTTTHRETESRGFLRENWIWIAAPIVIFVMVLLALMYMSRDGASPFIYTLW